MKIIIGEAPPPLSWVWPYLSGLQWGARYEKEPLSISYSGLTIQQAVGELVTKMIHRHDSPLHSLESAGIAREKLAQLFPSNKSLHDLGQYCIDHANELGLEFEFDEDVVLGLGFRGGRPLLPADLKRSFRG